MSELEISNTEYIIPSKEHPVFKWHNDFFGYIEQDFYKKWEIKTEQTWTIGYTFSTNLTEAINRLHTYIKENKENIPPRSKFDIVMIDGTFDKKKGIYLNTNVIQYQWLRQKNSN